MTGTRPLLLDLFSGIGGCSVGYARAGFDVEGVDSEPMPEYPYKFLQADAMELLEDDTYMARFAAVHASPPCPRYSSITGVSGVRDDHPDLLAPVTAALERWSSRTGGVWVVENVPKAPMRNPVVLCGSEFSLGATCRDGRWRQLRRHRLFDSNVVILRPHGCIHRGQPVGVYGRQGGQVTRGYMAYTDEAAAALGIDWSRTHRGLTNAIPPAYTEYLGGWLLEAVRESIPA